MQFYFQQLQCHPIYFIKNISTMAFILCPQAIQKIILLLDKPEQERQNEQTHFLYMFFKKAIKQIKDMSDWWMRYKCIQNLQVIGGKKIIKEQVNWVYVLKGQLNYLGMLYRTGQHLQINKEALKNINFDGKSLYVVLTHERKQLSRRQAEEKWLLQQKFLVKGILFSHTTILKKQFNHFWSLSKNLSLKKGEQVPLHRLQDMIFIVIKGSIIVNYNWERLIKLRELRSGSIFSAFLGRYFHKTSQQRKTMERFQFSFIAKEETLILGFCADIFYEEQKLLGFKCVVESAWNYYLARVSQTKRIIEQFGAIKPHKEEVIKNMQQQIEKKYLKQKIISIPVAIEKRKFRKIAYSLYHQKSNRRKVPNLASTQSVKQLRSQVSLKIKENPQINKFTINTQSLSARNMNSDFSTTKSKTFKLDFSRIYARSNTEKVRVAEFDKNCLQNSPSKRPMTARIRTLQQNGKELSETLINIKTQNSEQKQQHFYKFFRPEQFISKKLKNHYESLIMNHQKITTDVSQSPQKLKKYKYKKQQFEEYINQRRIMKIGPRRKILYKSKIGL